MYLTQEKMGQESLKPCKILTFSSQGADLLTTSVKVGFLAFFLVSLVLMVSSFFMSSCWSLECQNAVPDVTISPTLCSAPNEQDFEPTNISHVLFGIGGSVLTWDKRSQYSGLWWQPNVTRGYVWLEGEPRRKSLWPDNSPPHRISDWNRKHSKVDSAVRLARIVADSFRLGIPNVRWFVMGDDDTVFFTENLVTVLGKYDHRRMYYIGGISESVEQGIAHSFDMAFGGGGFAISYPLAARLASIMDGCLERYNHLYGSDARVCACVKDLGVPLTMERGFHQLDIRGHLFGLLAAHPLAPLVSLHHLDYVNPLFPNQSQYRSLRHLLQAYRADPGQLLQQSFCHHREYNWSVSVAWGYAVQIYPLLLPAVELEKPLMTFQTWGSNSLGPFVFNCRQLADDPCQLPIVYYLESIREDGEGGTVTIYKKIVEGQDDWCRKSSYAHAVTIKRILVSASKMDHKEWKSNRRRCCGITRVENGAMEMEIRRCNEQESITY